MSDFIINELNHLRNIGGSVEWAAMIIASDYLRKMGVMERMEAYPIIKAEWPEVYAEICKTFPDRVL